MTSAYNSSQKVHLRIPKSSLKLTLIPSFVTQADFSRLMTQMDGCIEARLMGRQPAGDQIGFVDFDDETKAAAAMKMYQGWTGFGGKGFRIELMSPLASSMVATTLLARQKRDREGEDTPYSTGPAAAYPNTKHPRIEPTKPLANQYPHQSYHQVVQMQLPGASTITQPHQAEPGGASVALPPALAALSGSDLLQGISPAVLTSLLQSELGQQLLAGVSTQQPGSLSRQQHRQSQNRQVVRMQQQASMPSLPIRPMVSDNQPVPPITTLQTQRPSSAPVYAPQQQQQRYPMMAQRPPVQQQPPRALQGPPGFVNISEQYNPEEVTAVQQPQVMYSHPSSAVPAAPQQGYQVPKESVPVPMHNAASYRAAQAVQYQQPPPHQYPPSSNVPVAAMPQDLLPRYTQQQQGPPPAQPPQHLQHITIQGSATAGDGVGYSMQQASGQVQQPAHPAVNQSGPVKLYMEGFPGDVQKRELEHIFRPFEGYIYKTMRVIHKDSRKVPGEKHVMCFIDFTSKELADEAMSKLQGYVFDLDDPDSIKLDIQYSKHSNPDYYKDSKRPGAGGRDTAGGGKSYALSTREREREEGGGRSSEYRSSDLYREYRSRDRERSRDRGGGDESVRDTERDYRGYERERDRRYQSGRGSGW